MTRISSVGHGARPLERLLAVLDAAGIQMIADIRRRPASRRHPHFGGDALSRALADRGIRYAHLRELGGWRTPRADSPHSSLRSAALRGYADHLASEEFRRGLDRLCAFAREAASAYLCAETEWRACHRRVLSDRLLVDGWEVVHLVRPGASEPHALVAAARVVEGTLVYDAGARGRIAARGT